MPSSEEEWRWTTADGRVLRVRRQAQPEQLAVEEEQLADVDDDSDEEEVPVEGADALAVEIVAARNAKKRELVAAK